VAIKRSLLLAFSIVPAAVGFGAIAVDGLASSPAPFIKGLSQSSRVALTVPANGDVNPYGVSTVPSSVGKLTAGSTLISNFNDKANQQGTGTTIVQISPAGHRSLFAQIGRHSLPGACPGGVGLTTALGILRGGYVVVGSLPTSNGMSATAHSGCLIVLSPAGKPVSTISGALIQGPWDMATVSRGARSDLFVSMALNGGAAKGRHTIDNSTVVRITLSTPAGQAPKVISQRVIAKGIPRRDDPAALVIGPTGVALASNGTLYLADTLGNRIAAIPHALTRSSAAAGGGRTVTRGGNLMGPLGLTVAPGGDIITANAGDGRIVETTPAGQQVSARTLVAKNGAGTLFGIAVAPGDQGLLFVNDGDNTLRLLHH
jgi:hypothetical protein